MDAQQLPGSYRNISSIFITATPSVFIVEQGRNRFLKLDLDGIRQDSVGRQGSSSYQFDRPVDIDATNELKIFVSDYNNNRIQVFDRRLQYLTSIQLPRLGNMRSYRPTYLAVNNLGEIFFYDEMNEYIYKFNFNGSFEQRFSTRGDDQILEPSGMTAIDDAVFIADPKQKVVHFISSNGRYLGFITGLENITAIASWNDKVFIADGSDIIVYNMFGRNLRTYAIKGIEKITAFDVYRDEILLSDGRRLYKIQRPDLQVE